ncbi:polysaccharide deacetylase family protein [Paenibacillus sp. A14]|uniref:polysaccharide deacetylase family protein n=1 Tax=Paenibacillus sp. A14 TaxID=3119820 RepID=UPI002FDF3333
MTLEQKLGYAAGTRLLIVNADDFGMCHAENTAIKQLLEEGAITSSTLMVPCGWARDAARWCAAYPDPAFSIGVHLTFTSEWQGYKWGPVTRGGEVGSIVTEEGFFPADCAAFERQADPEQIRREIVSQIEMARSLGVEPTHLDNHMGSLYGLATGRGFLDIVLEICRDYGLPFRLPRSLPGIERIAAKAEELAEQVADMADRMGIVILDQLIGLSFGKQPGETYESYKKEMIGVLRTLKPGVSEIILHPALANEELRAIHGEWEKRQWDFDLFRDPEIKETLSREGIALISWKELQKLQRQA